MSHTPGRWTVSEIDLTGEISEHYIFIEPNVAVIERKVEGKNEHDMADARLIAAAPAMLEALEDLVSLAEIAMCEANRDGAEYDIAEELKDARAAIKAAKGKA